MPDGQAIAGCRRGHQAAHASGRSRGSSSIPIDLGRPRRAAAHDHGLGRHRPPRRVMYVNAHVLNQSQERPELRAALQEADLVYCDGYGVRIAAKALELPVPHRMTGADWIWSLAALCEQSGASVYLLGSEPGRRPPGRRRGCGAGTRACEVAGRHHGFFELGSPHAERVVEDINARRPDILLVGHGHAQAGAVGAGARRRLDVDVFWTVGALFDYVSRPRSRARRGGWPTTGWNGSSDSASSRSGCGVATCWATRSSSRRVMARRRSAGATPPCEARLRAAGRASRVRPAGAFVALRLATYSRGRRDRRGRRGRCGCRRLSVVLFAVAGFGVVRLLLPDELRGARAPVDPARRARRRSRSR